MNIYTYLYACVFLCIIYKHKLFIDLHECQFAQTANHRLLLVIPNRPASSENENKKARNCGMRVQSSVIRLQR